MKPFCSPRVLLAVAAHPLLTLLASAHPGHDHSDIPSVIRHPLAGVEHGLIVALFLAAAAGAVMFGVKAWRSSSHHGARSRTGRRR